MHALCRFGCFTGLGADRAGASGNIGAELVVRSAPDGHTVLSTSSTYGIQAAVGKPPFDPVEDVTPIIAIARAHPLIIVNRNSPFRSLRDRQIKRE